MAQWIGSPNYTQGRQGERVLGVIIHWMDGNLASTDSVFQNTSRNTSAHYGVEDGIVHQYVREEDTAYQAGNWVVNTQTIGIEHSAQPGRDASPATLESSAQLVAASAKRWGFAINRNTVRKHSEIISTECPGTVNIDWIVQRANQLVGGAAPSSSPTVTSGQGIATVIVSALNVRSAPNASAPLAGSQVLHQGDTFQYQGLVQGELVNGVSTWIHSSRGNYVWAGGTNISTPAIANSSGGTATALRTTNVRTAPSTSASLGGSRQLTAGQTFQYSGVVTGQTVNQNGVTTNRWYHSTKGNYVWAGNCSG